jgi:hypothetical protein
MRARIRAPFGALDIHMDPPTIAGAGGKIVDPPLIDGDPAGDAELLAHPICNCRQRIPFQGHLHRSCSGDWHECAEARDNRVPDRVDSAGGMARSSRQ